MKNDIKKIEETEKVKNWDLIFETKKNMYAISNNLKQRDLLLKWILRVK